MASTAIPRPLPKKLIPVPTAAATAAPIEEPLAVATMRWNRYWGSFSSPSANSTRPRTPPPRQGAVSPLDRYCPTGRGYLFLVFPSAVALHRQWQAMQASTGRTYRRLGSQDLQLQGWDGWWMPAIDRCSRGLQRE